MKKSALFALAFLSGCYVSQPPPECTPGSTQSCVCSDGHTSSQTCNPYGTGWETCACGTTTPPPSCLPFDAIVLQCGCWGFVTSGQVVTATRCCSGYAIHEPCDPAYYGYCAGGTVPWGNRCE